MTRAFAAQPELGGSRRVELQMALGDFMVKVERVWSMLADGALAHAEQAWKEACDRHVNKRLKALLPT